MGNDVILKCSIPSFVADFVSVTAWVTSEGTQLKAGYVNGKMGILRKLLIPQSRLLLVNGSLGCNNSGNIV